MSDSRIGLYAHIPLCARRCDYCDFYVVVGHSRETLFFEWLERDLAASAAGLEDPRAVADTLYLGGGTPSFVRAEAIERVVDSTRRLLALDDSAEVTMEANPEGVSFANASAWRRAGINRLSVGVQSLSDSVLRPRGRIYSGADAIVAMRTARDAGFLNLSIDLIAGLPGETEGSFRDGIERCLDLSPEHVSVYLIETDDALKQTSLAREVREGREMLASEEEIVGMYAAAVELLTGAGYHHYEISNFARPGFESRHNLKYWRSAPYLGIGPSAHSYLGGRRFGRPADMAQWIEWVRSDTGIPAGSDYTLGSRGAHAREALTLRLRLIDGVDLDDFAAQWGYDARRDLAHQIETLVADGLLHDDAGRLALTHRGLLLSNEVFARIL